MNGITMTVITMTTPIGGVIPWAILCVALGLKVWRFTTLVRAHMPGRPAERELERVRASLERIWDRDLTC